MKVIKITLTLLIAVAIAAGSSLSAQSGDEARTGSLYSYYGLGSPVNAGTSQETGMGIIGVSFSSLWTPGLANPAHWGEGVFTRASAGFNFSRFNVKDSDDSGTNSLLAVNDIQVVFPIISDKLGLSAALYPSTRSNYKTFSQFEVYPNATDTVRYSVDKRGSGGVTKFEIGFGWKMNRYLSVGYAPSLAFVRSEDTEFMNFESTALNDNTTQTSYHGSAFAHRFGMRFRLQNLFRNRDLIQLGATVNLSQNIDVTREERFIKVVSGIRQENLIEEGVGNVSLPQEYAAGITYYPSNFLNVSAEGVYQQWDKAEYSFNNNEQAAYSDRYFLGVGGQYHPYLHGSDLFLSKFKYGAGISYDTGHLELSGEKINTLWFSTGIGILSPGTARSTFDLSLRYGIRGGSDFTSQGLVRERIWSVSLSVNLGELMFVRPKLR